MQCWKLRRERGVSPPSMYPFAYSKSDEFDGIVFLEEYDIRVARGNWLKRKFGRRVIPRELFQMVIDADITVDVLERWFTAGGIENVWQSCSVLFDEKDINKNRIRNKLLTAMMRADELEINE